MSFLTRARQIPAPSVMPTLYNLP